MYAILLSSPLAVENEMSLKAIGLLLANGDINIHQR